MPKRIPDNVAQKLRAISKQHDEFAIQLLNPEVLSDHRQVKSISIKKAAIESLVELFKSLFKITIVSVIAYQTIKGHWDDIPTLMGYGVAQTLFFMGEVMIEIMIKVLLVMIFLAALDFSFQKYTYLENLRMTKQEVKDERKDTEGNPQIKNRIRSVQLEMARRRMMASVPEADVVVTNPTHLAVALKYDRETMKSPKIIAKGARYNALLIRQIAEKNGVPLVENKPLAQMLFKFGRTGKEIPFQLFSAVAEILAYVYRTNRFRYFKQGREVPA